MKSQIKITQHKQITFISLRSYLGRGKDDTELPLLFEGVGSIDNLLFVTDPGVLSHTELEELTNRNPKCFQFK